MNGREENDQFVRLVDAIEPWLQEVVIIGGWAHQLYRLHHLAQTIDYVPLTTLDTDVAVPAHLPVKDQDLRERLLANGFEEERLGEDKPPATHYRLRNSDTGFYAEFLTPLMGSGDGRDGKSKATRRVAGVVSQQLRYLEVLLRDPWTVTVGPENGFPFRIAKFIQIANPASFLAQKILIQSKRTQEKFAKDILYVHDTLEIFGATLENIKQEWSEKIRPSMHVEHIQKVEHASEELFGEVNDSIREAARIGGARNLSAPGVSERCRFGLRLIFARD